MRVFFLAQTFPLSTILIYMFWISSLVCLTSISNLRWPMPQTENLPLSQCLHLSKRQLHSFQISQRRVNFAPFHPQPTSTPRPVCNQVLFPTQIPRQIVKTCVSLHVKWNHLHPKFPPSLAWPTVTSLCPHEHVSGVVTVSLWHIMAS